MAKGRKRTSDQSKRLRGTDQPCRMDGAVAPALTPSDLKVSSHIPHSPAGFVRPSAVHIPARLRRALQITLERSDKSPSP